MATRRSWNPVEPATNFNWPKKTLLQVGTPAIDTTLDQINQATGLNQIIAARNRKDRILGSGPGVRPMLTVPPPTAVKPAFDGIDFLVNTKFLLGADIISARSSLDTFAPVSLGQQTLAQDLSTLNVTVNTTFNSNCGLTFGRNAELRGMLWFEVFDTCELLITNTALFEVQLYLVSGIYNLFDTAGVLVYDGLGVTVQRSALPAGIYTVFSQAANIGALGADINGITIAFVF